MQLIKKFSLLLCLWSLGISATEMQDNYPLTIEMKICREFIPTQIHNCQATEVVNSTETAKLGNIAVHSKVLWQSDQRPHTELYMIWLYTDTDGNESVTKNYEDYENMQFTPKTTSGIDEHTFVGRIWLDFIGSYTILIYHNPKDYVNSVVQKIDFEVKQ